jgi:hypothetical protein
MFSLLLPTVDNLCHNKAGLVNAFG